MTPALQARVLKILRFDRPAARGLWIAHGHACGVRVQREGLTGLRPEGCGRLPAAGCVRFAQGATAPAALRVADCRSAAMLIKSALRDWLSVSYVTQYPVPPIFSFPLEGNASKRQRVYEGKNNYDTPSPVYAGPTSADLEVLCRTSTATPYPAAPDFPLFRGQNKPLYAFLQTTDSGLSLSYELLKEKFNKSIFPAGAAFFTVLFFFR